MSNEFEDLLEEGRRSVSDERNRVPSLRATVHSKWPVSMHSSDAVEKFIGESYRIEKLLKAAINCLHDGRKMIKEGVVATSQAPRKCRNVSYSIKEADGSFELIVDAIPSLEEAC